MRYNDDSTNERQARKLPSHRLSRLGQFATLATQIAGNVVTHGAKQWVKGERAQVKQLLLTPSNIERVANQLAHLRGAAMKLGQMISMDSGDFLAPELADILARLRSDADPMPTRQLAQVLEANLGREWQQHFTAFNFKPIASASIGQVHFAYGDDGTPLAVKVQYPGVRQSIDSDVDNVATMLRIIGLIPDSADYQGLLNEAKLQLHDEADYTREADFAKAYFSALKDQPEFIVPKIIDDCSTQSVLTMHYLDGEPIESLINAPQAQRNTVMTQLLSLLFQELFTLHMVQTDPNFANYRYQRESERIVLLDFGATRQYSERFSEGYCRAFAAVQRQDDHALNDALEMIGFFSHDILPTQRDAVISLIKMAFEPMGAASGYDFATSDLPTRLREAGQILSFQQNYWHTPPADAIFLHRKIGGMYLLASRLGAKVNVAQLVEPYTNRSI
ncbi:AarF/ABC1/UbiB kinase family protein [Vibrio sp. SM6]|uniref:AarF/ABC1/UbiB kinase family protein n=1 Tax=Vibrio agarilyticus TaxID=2726741 RepID=A0A7X8YG84_9VIBR|nr:AarF/ABC1/UbiB kinase family protein [Vibrio agarilyticus]NLS12112.1 AarF/ABC1/UbiB kinase family protein [Vibrio agarilyticus]